jgi:hypothetical protein
MSHIPVGSVLAWPDKFGDDVYSTHKSVWFLLGRASYANALQGAGILFSRKTAVKFNNRTKNLEKIGIPSSRMPEVEDYEHVPKASFAGLVQVCQDSELDFVVLDKNLGNGIIDWYHNKYLDRTYFLYDCRLIRNTFSKNR